MITMTTAEISTGVEEGSNAGDKFYESIRERVGENAYRTWFENTVYDPKTTQLIVDSEFRKG